MTVYNQTGLLSPNAAPRFAHACCFATFGQTGGSGSAGLGHGGVPWLLVYGGYEAPAATNPSPNSNLLGAPILPDGTLGPWVTLALAGWTPLAYARLNAWPTPYLTSCLMLSGGIPGAANTVANAASWVTAVRNAPASSATIGDWDTPGGWWQQLPTSGHPPVAGHTAHFDWPNGYLFLCRGTNNTTTAQTGIYHLPFGLNISNWTFNWGASWTAMTGSGVNATNAGTLYFMAPNAGSWGNSPKSYVYVFGGTTAVGIQDFASAQTAIYLGTITWSTSNVPTASWSSLANGLIIPLVGHGLVVADHNTLTTSYNGQAYDANLVRIGIVGGRNTSGTVLTAVSNTSLANPVAGGNIVTAFGGGPGGGVLTADMGAGGSVVADTSPDAPAGAQICSMTYGAITTGGALADGDQLLATVWVSDNIGGDPSLPDYAAIQIGQPPTITGIVPANASTPNNGRPAISFGYNAGLGGGSEDHWQVQVKQGANLIYDTGLRYDQQNAVPAMTIAPLLAPSTAYTLIITVWSTAYSLTGTQISATSTTSFTTTAFTVPGAPGSFAAVPSAANANVVLSWTAGASATGYNVYHRRTGTTPWTLLAQPGNVLTFSAMDHIALGVAYDYAVTSTSAVPAESAIASAQLTNVTIPLGTGSAYVHIATQGTAYGLWLQVQGSPAVAALQDSKSYVGFGQAAPVTRYGTTDYHTLGLPQTLLADATPATLKILQAIVDQVRFGGTLMYRDALGSMITGTFDASQALTVLPPYYRQVAIAITEVADLVGPYVNGGFAQGYPALTNGSRTPLDVSERLL